MAGLTTVTSGGISDGTITNADINASAAIDASKVSGLSTDSITEGNTSVEVVDTGSDGHILFDTEGSERMRITSSGDVGIGTAGFTPSAKLHIHNGYIRLGWGATAFPDGVSGPIIYGSNQGGSGLFSAVGNLILQGRSDSSNASNTNIAFVTGNTPAERMRIDMSGNVGIGTTSPSGLLHISGQDTTLKIQTGAATLADMTNDTEQKIGFQGGNAEIGLFKDSSGNFKYVIGTYQSTVDIPIEFRTKDRQTRIHIAKEGNVGIGTDNPVNAHLEVRNTSMGNLAQFRSFTGTAKPLLNITSSEDGVTLLEDGAVYGAIMFNTGAAERLRIASSGNVGIGTTSPQVLLHVHKSDSTYSYLNFTNSTTGSASGNGFQVGIGNDEQGTLWQFENNFMRFGTNNTERMRIDSSGRLLLGTSSTPTNSSALFVVQGLAGNANEQGTMRLQRGNNNGNNNRIGVIEFGGSDRSAAEIRGVGDGTWASNDYPGRLEFRTTADGQSSTTERMRIQSDGKILLNTTSTSETAALVVHGKDPGAGIYVATHVGGTSGGTSSPSYGLHVEGRAWNNATHQYGVYAEQTQQYVSGVTAGYFEATGTYSQLYGVHSKIDKNLNAATGGYCYYANLAYSGSGGEAAFGYWYNDTDSLLRFKFKANGGLDNYSGNNTNLCDIREKKNIEDLDSTWSCLKNWELKKFHYNQDLDSDSKRYGVIAQQVAEHCPEVIDTWTKQQAEPAKLDENGNEIEPAKEQILRMGVKEQQMMWMAIKALQEAQVRIETLEAEVASLKSN